MITLCLLGSLSIIETGITSKKNGIVAIKAYRGDKGVYCSNEFRADVKQFGQDLDLCGVGAHHQNGVAERAIRTISTAARAMMLHAMIHWPN